ncbi:MAG: SDR family NAD(P)-dependent oxidoreductase, partial [Spirochaetes bacterium]|nr:SDR family NAD(P)-dependent oxidoreductase [Spirochaetota bacterium]
MKSRLKTSAINRDLETRVKSGPFGRPPSDRSRDLAIIGLSCRFPGAPDADAYWANLAAGVNSIIEVPKDRWDPARYYSPDVNAPEKTVSKWGGFLEGIDRFDNRFFGISGREARFMDPQQRLLLETATLAIEDAALAPDELRRRKTGVYVGVMAMDYYKTSFAVPTDSYSAIGNYGGILANRISFAFGLEGASMSIDTACASSLVALHEARKAILGGEQEYALVGAVSLNFHPWKYISFSKSRMLSPDGQCRTFDKNANGYVPGEGVATVLVTTVAHALARGHRILGVVKGSAMGHTGAAQAITAPRVGAQCDVIEGALRDAGIGAETISYIEAHGTGTSLGDPIEVEALTQVFRGRSGKNGFCKIGSVKTNIGHLEAAAGLAGLIKVLLMFRHRQVPRHLNLTEVNPIIDFENSPFRVAGELAPWVPMNHPLRRAGISSFGFGGVNAHLILEEPDPAWRDREKALPAPGPVLLALSAASEKSLAGNLEAFDAALPAETIAQDGERVSRTLLRSRTAHSHRAGGLLMPGEKAVAWSGLRHGQNKPGTWRVHAEGLVKAPLVKTFGGISTLRERLASEAGLLGAAPPPVLLDTVAVLRFLQERLYPTVVVSASGEGRVAALVACGLLDWKEACLPVDKALSRGEVSARKALYPILLLGEHGVHWPLWADERYLESLCGEFQPSQELVDALRRKAAALLESQFTFKKLLEEWQKDLDARGFSFERLMKAGPLPLRERVLISVAIKTSLMRLNRKWKLREKELGNPLLNEWACLLSGDYLSRPEFLDLAVGPCATALSSINKRLVEIRETDELPLLKKHSKAFDGWDALRGGRGKNQASRTPPPFASGRTAILGGIDPETDLSTVAGFQRFLLETWLEGSLGQLSDLHGLPEWSPAVLPAYRFDRDRFWLDGASNEAGKLPTPALPTPPTSGLIPAGPGRYLRRYEVPADTLVAHHRIAGALLIPGAAMLELGLRAAEKEGAAVTALEDIQIPNPGVVVSQYEATIEIGPGSFRVLGAGKNLAQGKISRSAASAPVDAPVRPAPGSPAVAEGPYGPYATFAALGYEYGPHLQVLRAVKREGDGVVATIESGALLEPGMRLDPALLDGLFQMVLIALGGESFEPSMLYVPYALKRLTLWRDLRGKIVASLPAASLRREGREVVCDLWAWDASGEPVLHIAAMKFRQAPKALIGAQAAKGPVVTSPTVARALPGNLYFIHPEWAPRELGPKPALPVAPHFEAFTDRQTLRTHLAERLGSGAAQSSLVPPRDEKGFLDWAEGVKSLASEGGVKRPVHLLWAMDEGNGFSDGAELARLSDACVLSFFLLLKAIGKRLHGHETTILCLRPSTSNQIGQTAGILSTALGGLARTALLENKKLRLRLLEVEAARFGDAETLARSLEELQDAAGRVPGDDLEVKWDGKTRLVRVNRRGAPPPRGEPFRKDGVYLIAGGAGGIGLKFCAGLAGRVKAVGLLGRSALGEEKKKELEALSERGTRFLYERADLTDTASVFHAVQAIRAAVGPIHGVLHSGGHLEDGLLVTKTPEAFAKVFRPKALGAWALHEATENDPLDFFAVFSSIVSVIGNVGQCDYGAANAFLDGFAHWRRDAGFRGKSISVNWTLWSDGGMGQTDAVLTQLAGIGILPLASADALPAFDAIVTGPDSRVAIVAGDPAKLDRLFRVEAVGASAPNPALAVGLAPALPAPSPAKTQEGARAPLVQELRALLGAVLGCAPASIEPKKNISDYGADSVLVMELADKLAGRFGDEIHHQTILDNPTLESLASHIESLGLAPAVPTPSTPSVEATPAPPVLQKIPAVPAAAPTSPPAAVRHASKLSLPPPSPRSIPQVSQPPAAPRPAPEGRDMRVAVIGMSGRFPESPDLETFWEHLRLGHDLIRPCPKSRLDLAPWMKSGRPNQETYVDHAGFVPDIEWFDNDFFRIKDEDARLMDPQQRIFLELVQECLDRAGYYGHDIAGTQTAVFVGAGETEYARHPGEKTTKYEGRNGVVNTITNLIACRVSDFYDLHGPSWVVHTACSSSLVAIHNACQSILSGESEMAFAGGTELYFEETFFIGFSNSKVLSPDFKCRTFDKKANGFAMGEGAGVVLLKPYEKAVADGDRIYGVILASAANNDGKTMGLTTPNIHAQKRVIQTALERGKIDAGSISYYEAHGTGTYLGDPIEVKAASEVYRQYTQDANYCAIGSVKSNMGHSLMASGAVSFLKLLLCLRHRTLVPTLHCEEPHPGIGFGN